MNLRLMPRVLLLVVIPIAVEAGAVAPLAADDRYGVSTNTPVTIDAPGVLWNDTLNTQGTRSATLGATVRNGVLVFAPNGGFTYTPNPAFVGTDTFTYRITDSSGVSNEAGVTLVVTSFPIPAAPSELFVSEVRGNQVTLRWTPPASASTGYVIEAGPTAGLTTARVNAANPPFTLTAPNGQFVVRVRAVFPNPRPFFLFEGAPSNEVNVFVNQPIQPAPPRNLLATVTGDSLSLAWRNSYTAGEPTGVVLDVSGSIAASLPLALGESASFSGVPSGTYSLSLRSTNTTGTSGPSNVVTVTVPGPCSGPPEAPTHFLVHRILGTIFAFWEPPISGPAPTGYVLSVGGAFVASFSTMGRALSGTAGAGTYLLSVAATNPCGTSPPSGSRTVVF